MQRILIQPFSSGWRSAFLKDGLLSDFSFESSIQERRAYLDDIVCGRVTAVRNDFVWFELGLNMQGVVKASLFHEKKPCEGNFMWLQVVREPWPETGNFGHSEKGYRLTPHITFAGRYWLHTPSAPFNSKWTRRSAATNLQDDSSELITEKCRLIKQAEKLLEKPTKPGIVDRAFTQWQRWIRDSSSDLLVTCETPQIASRVKEWIAYTYPEKHNSVILALQTESPLFDTFGIEDQWEEALSPKVMLAGGGSLDIRELPAATLIDINTGTQRDNILNINVNALKSVAEQIKLRNITGNVLVDFIRLAKPAQSEFLKIIRDTFKETDVRVLGFCELGLLQLQRTRYRPSLSMELMNQCPKCHGDGFISEK